MALIAGMTVAAAILGFVLPVRSGVFGFLAAALVLFLGQVAINALGGYAGSSLEDSLLLFNGSYASYLGFNLQITYRAFVPPLLALAVIFIYRLSLRRN